MSLFNSSLRIIDFIFFSVLPGSCILFGGALIYIQCRKRTGFKCRLIPYRNHAVQKFKTSDESLSTVNTSISILDRTQPHIETVGIQNPLVQASETIEVDLFAFSRDITRSLQRKPKKSKVQRV